MVKKVLKWTAVVVVCFFGVIVAVAFFDPQPVPPQVETTAEAIPQQVSTTTAKVPVAQASSTASVAVKNKVTPKPQATTPVATPPATSVPSSQPQYGMRTKTSGCVADQALPDPACSPGAILTTDTSIICVSGYTQTVRDVPDSIRKQVFAEYGIDYSLHSNYEVDHLISLELGGSNDISNLFPESYSIQYGARIKDTLENYLHAQACSGKLSMAEAQREIATDWLKYYLAWKNSTAPASPSTPVQGSAPTPAPAATPASGHTFYLSTYATSKYYYCDTDAGWKSLSTSYLKSYSSESSLLADYPSRTLHAACQ